MSIGSIPINSRICVQSEVLAGFVTAFVPYYFVDYDVVLIDGASIKVELVVMGPILGVTQF